MITHNDITTNTTRLALDHDEVELALDLIDRALDHLDYIESTSLAEIDDDTRDTYRRVLLRDALKEALVATKGDRKLREEEEDRYLCVGGGR